MNAPRAALTKSSIMPPGAPNAPSETSDDKAAAAVDNKPLNVVIDAKSDLKLEPKIADIKPPTMYDLVTQVANAYTAAGWNIIIVYPIRGMVDIIAKKNIIGESTSRYRFHFVQVVPIEARETGKFIGQQKNDFIQNALSNQADPIHAIVTAELKRAEYKFKLSLNNPNTNAAVRL